MSPIREWLKRSCEPLMGSLPLIVFLSILLPILVTGCGMATTSSGHPQDSSMTIAMRDVSANIDELKHDVKSLKVDIQILEGKTQSQESITTGIRRQVSEAVQSDQDAMKAKLVVLERKLDTIDKTTDSLVADVRQLKTHANDSTSSLGQFKIKMSSLEQDLNAKIGSLKSAIETLTQALQARDPSSSSGSSTSSYRVKSGDSLERIARANQTTVDAIKSLNGLKSSKIVAGQELKLP